MVISRFNLTNSTNALRSTIWLTALFGAGAAVAWALHDPADVTGPNDPSYYWRMAEGNKVSAPFGYRIVVPSLVRALPVDHHVGFVLVTAASVTVLAAATWLWLRRHVDASRAVAGVALVLASGPIAIQLQCPYLSDATMMALIAVAVLLADREQWRLFAVVAIATVLARDAAVIVALVPLAAWVQSRNRSALLAAAAAVATCVVARALIPVIPRPFQPPRDVLAWRAASDGGLTRAAIGTALGSFGAAWLFVPLSWKRIDSRTKRWALVAVASVPVLFIASDWTRLLAPAFPLIAMAAVRSSVATKGLFVIASLLFATTIQPTHIAVRLLVFAASTAVIVLWRDTQATDDATIDIPSVTSPRHIGSAVKDPVSA